jgi:hypothetical protein
MSIHNELAFSLVVIVVDESASKQDKRHGGCEYASQIADVPERPCCVVLEKEASLTHMVQDQSVCPES